MFLTAADQDAAEGIREELAAAAAGPGARNGVSQFLRALSDVPGEPGSRRRQPRVRDHRSPARAGPRAPCPRTRVCTIAVSKVIHLRLHGSPWSAFHGGHRPGRCRQPGEPGFPPACASAAVTGCNWGCSTPLSRRGRSAGRDRPVHPHRAGPRPRAPPVRAQSSFGCGFRCRSTGSSCRSGRERPGSSESPRKPVTKRGRGTHAPWPRAKRGPPRRPPEWPAGGTRPLLVEHYFST